MITRRLALVFTCSFGGTVSFYLLLSVVPLYATSVGAGDVGAGFTTATLMLATVAAELATPRLIARLGYRTAFALGLVLLGLPALALAWSDRMAVILVVCLIRGVGFAIVAVIGSAIVAILVPPERRGEGLGLYGIVVGIPSVVALPLGVWLATRIGFTVVFVAGAGIAIAGLLAVHSLPGKAPAAEDSHGIMAGLRNPLLLRPSIIFAATTMATGIVVTFLPVVTGGIAPFALLAQAASATAARWLAGKHADRHGPAGLLLPGVVVSALGMLTLVFVSGPVAVQLGDPGGRHARLRRRIRHRAGRHPDPHVQPGTGVGLRDRERSVEPRVRHGHGRRRRRLRSGGRPDRLPGRVRPERRRGPGRRAARVARRQGVEDRLGLPRHVWIARAGRRPPDMCMHCQLARLPWLLLLSPAPTSIPTRIAGPWSSATAMRNSAITTARTATAR